MQMSTRNRRQAAALLNGERVTIVEGSPAYFFLIVKQRSEWTDGFDTYQRIEN